jgi:hypothetical protein
MMPLALRADFISATSPLQDLFHLIVQIAVHVSDLENCFVLLFVHQVHLAAQIRVRVPYLGNGVILLFEHQVHFIAQVFVRFFNLGNSLFLLIENQNKNFFHVLQDANSFIKTRVGFSRFD